MRRKRSLGVMSEKLHDHIYDALKRKSVRIGDSFESVLNAPEGRLEYVAEAIGEMPC